MVAFKGSKNVHIHISHYTRSQCSVETASASSQSCTSLGGGFSQFPWIKDGRGPGGKELEVKLMFVVDVDLAVLDKVGPGLSTQKLRHGLKRHPFAQTRKAQVCSLFPFKCQI